MTLFLFFALLPTAACHPIHSDSILGRDLAAALPEFSKLAPDLPLGLSPLPGQIRLFRIADLRHIAQVNRISPTITEEVCFAWPVSVVGRESLAAAMKASLGAREARIGIVEQSLVPAPAGTIVFPLSGLSGASEGPVLWRGYVEYAERHRFPIWARVRLTAEEKRVTAVSDLTPDQPIRADQLQLTNYSGPLSSRVFLMDPSKAIGAIPRRSIPAGSALTEDMIQKPFDVERGAVVNVIVQSGAAHVEAQGIAEQSGHRGDIISVKNPKSARPFRARITESGTVIVVPGGLIELVPEQKPL